MPLLALLGYWIFPPGTAAPHDGRRFRGHGALLRHLGRDASDPVSSVSNQYAAMPSMHVGWSLWSGITLARLVRSPWLRVLGICYPVATFLVVVATGNHFVLDAVAALVLFVFAAAIVNLSGRKVATVAVPRPALEVATNVNPSAVRRAHPPTAPARSRSATTTRPCSLQFTRYPCTDQSRMT